MNKLEDTQSLCEHCYRHVPAVRFERDGQIWLWKKCKWHGESEHLVEPDAEFYLNYKYNSYRHFISIIKIAYCITTRSITKSIFRNCNNI